MPVRAVGFDLDGTLAVPDRDRATLLREACEAVGAPAFTREEYLAAHGEHLTAQTRESAFAAMLDGRDAGVDPGELAAAYRRRVTDALRPVPGAEGLLATLRGEYRVGLLTNGPALAQRSKVRRLGWTDAFDAVLVTGELPAGKPDGRAFAALVDALGAEPGATAYVGDQPDADVGGASAAGLRAVQVTYPAGPAPDPRASAHVDRADLAERLPATVAEL